MGKTNPPVILCLDAGNVHYRSKITLSNCARSRRRLYGVTPDLYKEMLLNQHDVCLICGKLNGVDKKSLAVDHCHTTGVIRGLLCGPCNTKFAWYEKYSKVVTGYLKDKTNERT